MIFAAMLRLHRMDPVGMKMEEPSVITGPQGVVVLRVAIVVMARHIVEGRAGLVLASWRLQRRMGPVDPLSATPLARVGQAVHVAQGLDFAAQAMHTVDRAVNQDPVIVALVRTKGRDRDADRS